MANQDLSDKDKDILLYNSFLANNHAYLSQCPLSAEHCQGLPILEVGELVGVKPGREWLDEGDDGRVSSGQSLLPLLLPLLPDNGGPEHDWVRSAQWDAMIM